MDNFQTRDENGLRLQTYKRFKVGEAYSPISADQMAALIGFIKHCNEVHKNGSCPKYPILDEFLGVIDAYWDVLIETNQNGTHVMPDVEGFCCFAGISRETLNAWERDRPEPYPAVIKHLKNAIAATKKQLACTGKIPQVVFATDFNNNHGYTQRQEIALNPPADPLGPEKNTEDIVEYRKQLAMGIVEDE